MNGYDLLLNVALPVLLFVVGWVFGRMAEKNHWQSIEKDEAALAHINTSNQRFIHPESQGFLVLGSVVVAQDYFKMTLSYIISLFGGRLTPYESLMERARREAIIRIKKQADIQGATQIYGLRIEVTNVNEIGTAVEAIAYGTACFQKAS